MKKSLFLLFFSLACCPVQCQNKPEVGGISIKKNQAYKGVALDILFQVRWYKNGERSRNFSVIKTNSDLKNFFLADYLLVEKSTGNEILYYPMGWTTDKIKVEEIRQNCSLIIAGNVMPVDAAGL